VVSYGANLSASAARARTIASCASSMTLVAVTGPQPKRTQARIVPRRANVFFWYPGVGSLSSSLLEPGVEPPYHLSMIAALLASLLSTAPVLEMTEPQLDAKIAEAHRLPFAERIDALSRLFVGVPYTDLPLGDGNQGPEPGPLFRTDGVDCQTYVETVLAMANGRSLDQAKAILDDIRYADGKPSFQSRNHFTEAQWLPANARKGYLADEVPALDRRAPTETLILEKSQWTQVPGLKRLIPANVPEGKFKVRYLPLDQVEKRAKDIPAGTVVMVVREHDPNRVVRITHMGFMVRTDSGLAVRHASTGKEHAVIDEPLDAFVRRQGEYKKWKVIGVALARPLDASRRVSRIQTASR
jgi:hypothetical protein